VQTTDCGGFSDDAVPVHSSYEAPHLWVTSSPENLVYRGYKGNRVKAVPKARASILMFRP
jgi:hypothetical protein